MNRLIGAETIVSDRNAVVPGRWNLLAAARKVADDAFTRAAQLDEDGAFPAADIAALHGAGLLASPLPRQPGGAQLATFDLCRSLRLIGGGSLALGRLFEGHVNALHLILRYGRPEQIDFVAREVNRGHLFGVWNTDDKEGLRIVREHGRYRLQGRKVLCSGAGCIERPLATATDDEGRRLMVVPRLIPGERADLSRWTAHGMRASATGTVDFSGVAVEPIEILGEDGDYERQPAFSGGAWRFAAVHQGGMEKLLELLCDHLRSTGRGADPHQAARVGQAGIATETARLWVERAATIAEDSDPARSPAQIVAYVNLARLAVEKAGLELMELVHRSVGLQGFMRPNPIERISRDLATYLRQPGPDRALTGAAAWMLASETSAAELWV
jgi:alkylation response protein AidB-like acyl-CoA dehydrogenase